MASLALETSRKPPMPLSGTPCNTAACCSNALMPVSALTFPRYRMTTSVIYGRERNPRGKDVRVWGLDEAASCRCVL